MPCDGEFIHEPVPTVDLRSLTSVLYGRIAREQLGDRGLPGERLTDHNSLRRVVVREPRNMCPGLHVGEFECDRLMPRDRRTERLPLARVANTLVEATLR